MKILITDNAYTVLSYLKDKVPKESLQIETDTGLKKQYVFRGLQILLKFGLITKKEITNCRYEYTCTHKGIIILEMVE